MTVIADERTFTLSSPLDVFDAATTLCGNPVLPDLNAPLPLGYAAAIDRAVMLRRHGAVWSWPTIAQVMGEYHGFWRSAGWWGTEIKRRDPSLARPHGKPFDGPVSR
jgi:hypothetical protein